MILMNDIEKLSDFECINLIDELIQRLKATTYARGYKDGFNDAKSAEHQKSLFMKSDNKE